MAKLPNATNAIVDRAKLTDYVLNSSHRVGRNKARVFLAAIGMTADDAGLLETALQTAVAERDGILERSDDYGAHYSVEFVIEVRGRSATVRSLWTVRAGEDFPRFVSAFVR
jgi:hypothetical protein